MIVLEDVLRDRGSRYAASVGPVRDKAGIDAFLAQLRARASLPKPPTTAGRSSCRTAGR